ncbi:MAG TPA: hypothetical protein PKD59_13230 [Miltoncostaeaceae bacterium]|nr:hypothetical protein [Miltoncostaeaceae bacterium]
MASDDHGLGDRTPYAVRRPNIAGQRLVREDQGTHGIAGDVEQGWVTALVGAEIDVAEGDAVGAPVVVDGEVDEVLVPASPDVVADELRRQPPVAPCPRHEVDAVARDEEVARDEARAARRGRQARREYGAVLIAVSGEEMVMELQVGA